MNNAAINGATVDWEPLKTLKFEDVKVCSKRIITRKSNYRLK